MAASSFITRRVAARSILLGLPAAGMLGGRAWAEGKPATVPGADWEKTASPEAAGFRSSGFEALEAQLVTLPTTAFMVVSGGRVAYTYGDVAQASYLASARKSVLSMLFDAAGGEPQAALARALVGRREGAVQRERHVMLERRHE